MDEADRAIVAMLREDSRRPFTEIGKRLRLTEGAVRHRVKALTEAGVIRRFTIEAARPGMPAVVGVSVEPRVSTREVCSRIVGLEGVERSFEVAGDLDVVVLVYADTSQALNATIDAIRALPGVVSTISYLVLGEHVRGG